MEEPGVQVVVRIDPYCQSFTISGSVSSSHTLAADALISILEEEVSNRLSLRLRWKYQLEIPRSLAAEMRPLLPPLGEGWDEGELIPRAFGTGLFI
jgi:hypothetical protein